MPQSNRLIFDKAERCKVRIFYHKPFVIKNSGEKIFAFKPVANCEHKLVLPKTEEIKFFADVNVARLVRWLRAIGIDTAWEDAISDADLVRRAIRENRFVLTLDKRLIREWRADTLLLLQNEKPLEQFREIVVRFEIERPNELFTRCLVCNTLLRNASVEEISANAPPNIQKNDKKLSFPPEFQPRLLGKLAHATDAYRGRRRFQPPDKINLICLIYRF